MFFSVNRIKICVALIVIIALLQMISLFKIFDFQYLIAVSYTHLTLPTT